ncbi:hypothetical protein RFI_28760 [Reticulomyxa filosa]|uniref:Protein kinase domain-containing protein n=1 Tax=Reticulomyxa filosa TaxID=46433 RepID=X6M583_RETFI|nr:hypothetical protein RFI_28760 [Reticulomyxa filosa]|eukprot:ETO08627.1 hypothetical protein RFI_28760 [Reticulomyxa filosa]
MSSFQTNLRFLDDIKFFVRNTYSHTIHLQKSLLGEVILGTVKIGNGGNGFEPYDSKIQSYLTNAIGSEAKKSNNSGDLANAVDVSVSLSSVSLPSPSPSSSLLLPLPLPLAHEKHVIKICDKSVWRQLNDHVLENPLMEIELMQNLCVGNSCYPYFTNECAYSLFRLFEGDLCNYIQAHGAFEFERARRYAKQITLAVEHLHKHGYCHLDLSLENILLDQKTDTVKLCDFGLCRKMLSNKKAFEAASIRPGKKSYIAPEVYNYSPFYGDKADIFSLGVIYFILFCGFPPFHKPCLNDTCFRYVYDKDINVLLEKWQLTHVITPQCVDILNKIFVPDSKRIGMQELLAHPFWVGVQLNELDSQQHSMTAKMEIKEELTRNRIPAMCDQLPQDSFDSNPMDHYSIENNDSEAMDDSCTIGCQDQNEMKFASDNTTNQDYPLNRRCLDLELHPSRRDDLLPQQHVSCEIRKRTLLPHGTGEADMAMENLTEGIWNFEIQSDVE